MKKLIAAVAVSVCVVGCATKPEKIQAVYVAPQTYAAYDCGQIATEMESVSQRTSALYTSLKKEANADAWQMGVGMLLFWPALFALEGGDGPEASEYAYLKGQYKALHSNAIQRKCHMAGLPPSPEETAKQLAQKSADAAETGAEATATE